MKKLLSFTLLCCLSIISAAEEITIDPDRAVISARQANGPAALELKTHLELITGKKIPVLGRSHLLISRQRHCYSRRILLKLWMIQRF